MFPSGSATAAPRRNETDPQTGYVDPRVRPLPARHRIRLGVELMYMRLTQAAASNGETQRFHLLTIGPDLAYQLQFLKYAMVRPSFAFIVNAANSFASMPAFIHPKIHFGFQGALFGAAVGYGYFTPVYYLENAVDPIRGGLGAPIILHNHHVDGEVSITTQIDRGALSFMLRFSMSNGKLWHYNINAQRDWRPLLTLNVGWYFGDGRRQRQRQRARQAP